MPGAARATTSPTGRIMATPCTRHRSASRTARSDPAAHRGGAGREWVGDPAFDALRIVVAETACRTGWSGTWSRASRSTRRLAARERGRSDALLLPCRRRGRLHDGGGDGRAHPTRRTCSIAPATSGSPSSSPISRAISSEDDRRGRCYLPADWLAEADIPPGEHMKPIARGLRCSRAAGEMRRRI
jgi:hypothetical protein